MLSAATLLTAAACIALATGLLGVLGTLSVWRNAEAYAQQLSGGQQLLLFLLLTANIALLGQAVLLLINYPLNLLTLSGNVIAVLLLRLLSGLFVTGLRWQAQLLNVGLCAAVVLLGWYGGLDVPSWVDLPFMPGR